MQAGGRDWQTPLAAGTLANGMHLSCSSISMRLRSASSPVYPPSHGLPHARIVPCAQVGRETLEVEWLEPVVTFSRLCEV